MPKPRQPKTAAEKRRRVRRTHRLRQAVLALLAAVALVGGYLWYSHRGPMPPTAIFQGVTYQCEQLPVSAETGGKLHLVTVDLNTPGVEFFVTGISGSAATEGYDYHLSMATGAAREDDLAVLINGTYFSANTWWVPLPGDLARARETIIVPSQASRREAENYLLWLDDKLTPHVERAAPANAEALAKAKWGIGGLDLAVLDGQPQKLSSAKPGPRTLLGVDTQKKLLFMAVFEKASYDAAARILAQHGVKDAITLSGGYSSVMVIGDEAKNVRPGAVVGGWRPLATFVGVRARPLARR
ncbi:MAG: phosphodiester glycosidase family protein [Planctomycetes bacterium]|nr:phosphodiester glycosidase family protein [Planctomycetota bacterium]